MNSIYEITSSLRDATGTRETVYCVALDVQEALDMILQYNTVLVEDIISVRRFASPEVVYTVKPGGIKQKYDKQTNT